MIGYLKGTILKKNGKSIILDTGGVGYVINVPAPTADKCFENDAAEFYIHTKVREDDLSLFGFETFEELEFFKTLINVNGVGPKTALEILSLNPDKTKAAILSGDVAFLCKIPGIGKKTAERIIVELKNKIEWADTLRLHANLEENVNNEAIEALLGLGYQRFEIIKVLNKLPETVKKTEEIITYFLKNI
jgi:Holliday junction DNA helicase RuvA